MVLSLKINNVSIRGISTVVPRRELCLLDDKTLYDGNEKQLKRVMKSSGFNKRRVVDENTTSADLCQRAAEILFKDMGVSAESIDAVIFVTQTLDILMACISLQV